MSLEPIEPEALHDLLGLVMEEPPTIEQCAARSMLEREIAARWAATTHLCASDNLVRISRKPAWLDGVDGVDELLEQLTVKLRGRVRNIAEAEGERIRWGWAPASHTRLEALGILEHVGDHAKLTDIGKQVALRIGGAL